MKNAFLTYVLNLLETGKHKGLEWNSAQVQPGQIFVALKGTRHHGAEFANEAVNKGAVAILTDKEGAEIAETQYRDKIFIVDNVVQVLHHLCSEYRDRLKGTVIGVTGSSGKTTVKEMITAVLSTGFRVHSSRGNFNNELGFPYSLLNAPMEADFFVFEIGTNHPGEIRQLASMMRPDWSVITMIGTAHIGFFGSQQAIYEEKTDLFRHTREDGTIFLNLDDSFLRQYQDHRRKVTFSLQDSLAKYRFHSVKMTGNGCVRIQTLSGREFSLAVPGRHQAMNSLIAYSFGMEAGLKEDDIIAALANFRSPDKRMEIVMDQPCLIINDAYNANRESVFSAIDFLEQVEAGRKIFVFGDIFELGDASEKIHREIGERLQQSSFDFIFMIGQETGKIVNKIGMDERIRHFASAEELVKELISMIKPGDAIVFKASRGMKLEEIVNRILEAKPC